MANAAQDAAVMRCTCAIADAVDRLTERGEPPTVVGIALTAATALHAASCGQTTQQLCRTISRMMHDPDLRDFIDRMRRGEPLP